MEYPGSVNDFHLGEIGEFHHLGKKLKDFSEQILLRRKGCGCLTWKVAVMMACEATIAAKMAIIKAVYKVPGGAELKKGFEYASGWTLM